MGSAHDTCRTTIVRRAIGVALVAGMTVGYAPRAQAQAFSPAEIKGLTI